MNMRLQVGEGQMDSIKDMSDPRGPLIYVKNIITVISHFCVASIHFVVYKTILFIECVESFYDRT